MLVGNAQQKGWNLREERHTVPNVDGKGVKMGRQNCCRKNQHEKGETRRLNNFCPPYHPEHTMSMPSDEVSVHTAQYCSVSSKIEMSANRSRRRWRRRRNNTIHRQLLATKRGDTCWRWSHGSYTGDNNSGQRYVSTVCSSGGGCGSRTITKRCASTCWHTCCLLGN